jgi:O-antigen/teichoic acid export membrane protein
MRWNFLKAIAVYGTSQAGVKIFDLLSFSLITLHLSMAQLGIYGAVTALEFIIIDIVGIGVLRIGSPRFAIDPDINKDNLKANVLGFFLLYATAATVGILLFTAPLLHLMGIEAHLLLVQLLLGTYVAKALTSATSEIFRMQSKAPTSAIFEIGPAALRFLLLALATFTSASAAWLVGGTMLASQILAAGITWATHYRTLRPKLDLIRPILRYSAPLCLHRFMTNVNSVGDRWVVGGLLGLEILGAYTFLYRIGDLAKTLLAPVQRAWMPIILDRYTRRAYSGLEKATQMYIAISAATFVVSLLAVPFLASAVDSKSQFTGHYEASGTVVLVHGLMQVYNILGVAFFVVKRVDKVVPISAAAALLNLLFTYLLATYSSINFVAFGTVISSAFFIVVSYFVSRKLLVYRDRKSERICLYYVAFCLLVFGIYYTINPFS